MIELLKKASNFSNSLLETQILKNFEKSIEIPHLIDETLHGLIFIISVLLPLFLLLFFQYKYHNVNKLDNRLTGFATIISVIIILILGILMEINDMLYSYCRPFLVGTILGSIASTVLFYILIPTNRAEFYKFIGTCLRFHFISDIPKEGIELLITLKQYNFYFISTVIICLSASFVVNQNIWMTLISIVFSMIILSICYVILYGIPSINLDRLIDNLNIGLKSKISIFQEKEEQCTLLSKEIILNAAPTIFILLIIICFMVSISLQSFTYILSSYRLAIFIIIIICYVLYKKSHLKMLKL